MVLLRYINSVGSEKKNVKIVITPRSTNPPTRKKRNKINKKVVWYHTWDNVLLYHLCRRLLMGWVLAVGLWRSIVSILIVCAFYRNFYLTNVSTIVRQHPPLIQPNNQMISYLNLVVSGGDSIDHDGRRSAGVLDRDEPGSANREVLRVGGIEVHVSLLHGRVLQDSGHFDTLASRQLDLLWIENRWSGR